jgi:SNF2 family DNA or RNA helicase
VSCVVGGILGDDIGLGKTVTLLALIDVLKQFTTLECMRERILASNIEHPTIEMRDASSASYTLKSCPTPKRQSARSKSKHAAATDITIGLSRATLIVVPASLLLQVCIACCLLLVACCLLLVACCLLLAASQPSCSSLVVAK